jgi:hypothetical protein
MFVEYPCPGSTAISRMAVSSQRGEVMVQYKDSPDLAYLYRGVDGVDVERRLQAGESSGRIVAYLRQKRHNFQKLKGFTKTVVQYVNAYKTVSPICMPGIKHEGVTGVGVRSPRGRHTGQLFAATQDNNRKQSSSTKDYSPLWLEIVENPSRYHLQYFEFLLQFLEETCDGEVPPTKRPPPTVVAELLGRGYGMGMDDMGGMGNAQAQGRRGPAGPSSAHTVTPTLTPTLTPTKPNFFHTLASDSEGEEEVKPLSGSGRSIQVRYLGLKIACGITEMFRGEAAAAERKREYGEIQQKWTAAWQVMNMRQSQLDEWLAVILENDLFESVCIPICLSLPNGHDAESLVEVMQGVEILVHDTEVHKKKALDSLRQSLSFVERKLNPMLKDRDGAKASMGGEKWANNPAPRNDHADRRVQWEESKRVIDVAIQCIDQLDFQVFILH